jgi:hypothetical protein
MLENMLDLCNKIKQILFIYKTNFYEFMFKKTKYLKNNFTRVNRCFERVVKLIPYKKQIYEIHFL